MVVGVGLFEDPLVLDGQLLVLGFVGLENLLQV